MKQNIQVKHKVTLLVSQNKEANLGANQNRTIKQIVAQNLEQYSNV
jgi:hypothetical protein